MFLNKTTNYYKNSQCCRVLWLVLALNNSWQQKLQLEFSACQKFSNSMFLFTLVTLSAMSQHSTIAFTQPFKPIGVQSRFSNFLSSQLSSVEPFSLSFRLQQAQFGSVLTGLDFVLTLKKSKKCRLIWKISN